MKQCKRKVLKLNNYKKINSNQRMKKNKCKKSQKNFNKKIKMFKLNLMHINKNKMEGFKIQNKI